MSTLWVILIVVALVVVVAVVVMRRRAGEPGEARERAGVAAGEAGVGREEEAVGAPEAARTPESVTAEKREPVPESKPSAEVEEETRRPLQGTGTETAEVEEEKKPEPPKAPPPTAEEIRGRVESQLADAERMLGELREAAEGKEGEPGVDPSMLAILEEGLQEVRSLLAKKRLDPAREKGEALHAQLALFLQSARREQSS